MAYREDFQNLTHRTVLSRSCVLGGSIILPPSNAAEGAGRAAFSAQEVQDQQQGLGAGDPPGLGDLLGRHRALACPARRDSRKQQHPAGQA